MSPLMANLVLLEFFAQRTTVDTKATGGFGLVVVVMIHDREQQGFFDFAHNHLI